MTMATDLKICDHIRYASCADGVILLDLESGAIHSIHQTGLELWNKLAANLSSERQSAPEVLAEPEISTLVDGLVQTGVISLAGNRQPLLRRLARRCFAPFRKAALSITRWTARGALAASAKGWVSNTATMYLLLVLFDLNLRLLGFAQLHALVDEWRVVRRLAAPGSIKLLRGSLDAACRWYPVQALCLLRSSVLTASLRQQGVPAELVFCFNKLPFMGHAWVEVYKRVVSEDNARREVFTELYRMEAR
jgi:hypothetical protein